MDNDTQDREIQGSRPAATSKPVVALPARPYATPVALRALAFVWVLVNVYFVAVRISQPATLPITLLPAGAVTVLTSWAAIEGKRWGWLAMVFLVVGSLADLCVGFVLVTLAGISSGLGGADLRALWLHEVSSLGLGPAYGIIVVLVWVVSLAVLVTPGVGGPIFLNKREHLGPGQAVLALALLVLYLLGLAAVGSTASAMRLLRRDLTRSVTLIHPGVNFPREARQSASARR